MLEMEVFDLINALVLIIGIMFMGLIILGVYNVIVRKKKVNNMYTPFDDATQGIKEEDEENQR